MEILISFANFLFCCWLLTFCVVSVVFCYWYKLEVFNACTVKFIIVQIRSTKSFLASMFICTWFYYSMCCFCNMCFSSGEPLLFDDLWYMWHPRVKSLHADPETFIWDLFKWLNHMVWYVVMGQRKAIENVEETNY